MIILHASYTDGHLFLWGETPTSPLPGPFTQRGQKRQRNIAAFFPYGADAAALSAVFRHAAGSVAAHADTQDPLFAWLPTLNGQPLASSPLIAELPESNAHTTLAPWLVTTVKLTPPEAVSLLCACVNTETLAPGMVVGRDLAFWATALRFAGALVARQQFLPVVRQGGERYAGSLVKTEKHDRYRAGWEPVFLGADATRLAQLAKAMPPVCRALTREVMTPPDTPALTALTTFLHVMVDSLVRFSLRDNGTGKPPAALAKPRRLRLTESFASVHDHWLYTLRAAQEGLVGDASLLAQLAEQMREWQRPITAATATPFRLCFRLEEPAADDVETDGPRRSPSAAWYVRYLLQASDDPSLLVPAADAWTAAGRSASIFARRRFAPREYLLTSLGQAAGISPQIEDSLRKSTPNGYALDTSGAHEFLAEKAWLLEQAGFGVLLPAWWTGKGTKLRLTARATVRSPKMQGGSGLSLDQLIRFNWEVALGDETLSLSELQLLARLKAPLVKVRGQWVQLNAEEIQAALKVWKRKTGNELTVRALVRMALGAGTAPGGMPFVGVTATGWIADLLAQLNGRVAFEELPQPETFRGTLRPYQLRGYSWLAFLRRWGLGACLADDMGLGKTPQTLALIQRDWQTNGKRPVLLICPTSVVGNWQKEAARFTPELPVIVHHGLTRTKGAAFKRDAAGHAIVLSSYALLHRDFEFLNTISWAGVILDEAQNIKNPETKQARAARSLPAEYHLALTGTPVENHVGDLWSIIEFLNPGFLGTQAEFKRMFFVPIQADRDPEATERLKRLTGPFILRRLKTDKAIIADLPEKLEMKVYCTLTKEQGSLYAAVVEEATAALESAEGIQRRGVILATLSKLKQVCNHPAHFLGDNSAIPGRSGKLARLTEMLEEALSTGDRALVFSQFAEMGEILKRHLQETFGREVLFLHGAVPKKQRDRMIERFQTDDDGPRIFVLSLKAGGTGLNLTAANHVFHFDRWWNPAVENQATDRAFRIGQRKNVQVHKFLCVGTLEEKIDEMITRKQEIAAQAVGAGEGWLTELSTEELKELFALRREAVGE
jgi:SNF2 family DNA or RNA helicase